MEKELKSDLSEFGKLLALLPDNPFGFYQKGYTEGMIHFMRVGSAFGYEIKKEREEVKN